jgi:hypothetical protein
MLGPFDYALWLVSFAGDVCILVCALRRRQFFQYLSLNVFIIALAVDEVLRFTVLRMYGFASIQYRYLYYYTDSLLVVVMFVAISGLYRHVFRDAETAKYIRGWAVVVLSATSLVSFLVIQRERSALTTRFVVELGQNLYFTGVTLTYILWLAMFKRGEARTRIVLIVTAFGVFFSAYAVTYALRGLLPNLAVWHVIPPLLGTWLPLSLAYTFAKVPEEARIAALDARGTHS